MNVLRSGFLSRQKKLQIQREKNLRNNFNTQNLKFTKLGASVQSFHQLSSKGRPNRIKDEQSTLLLVGESALQTRLEQFNVIASEESKQNDETTEHKNTCTMNLRKISQPHPFDYFQSFFKDHLLTEESLQIGHVQKTTEIPMHANQNHNIGSVSSCLKTPKNKSRKSPKTSGLTKVKNSESLGGYILAVTEGRGIARGEVGIAGMDPKRPFLVLSQISDGQRYVNSLTKMNVFDFSEVLVPSTFVECGFQNKLYSDIRSRFPNATLTSVQRRHFSETIGIDLIRQYCSAECASLMVLLRDKFYALSAAAALIKYIEFAKNVHLAPHSLKIEYQGTEDGMLIDLDTANRLELVMCISNPKTNFNNSLLGVVNHCHTKGGVRLLRANLLQPFCCLSKIQNRLNSVEELVDNPIFFSGLEATVAGFANVEDLLNLCMHIPQQDGLRVAECQLKYTLLLKTTLEFLPKLIDSLKSAKSNYFREVVQTLEDPRFNVILNRITETVFGNTRNVKGSVATHMHGCFAIKAGVNSLLDIAKKTYCEIIQEITDHVTKLRETHDLPLRISFSANKGFHIQCSFSSSRGLLKKKGLPEDFILVQKSKAGLTFYTADLVALDQRSQHVLDEIKLMTNTVLFEMLTDIRQHIGCLFNLCEIIAELDVLISFAHVSSGKHFVKPIFGNELNLKESRHPILDVTKIGETVPNDVNARDGKNFTIVTGPNQSGKSIYIRQVALLQIMAQIGCFIPAREATFKLINRLFTRINFDDSIENNACTLVTEMKDMDYIKQNLTRDSLVIIDELCRGTSVDEGTSLALAICEEMLDTPAFIFFTTHYLFLTKLEEMYPNVINCHFEFKFEILEGDTSMTGFTYALRPGITKADSYGLKVAELTAFPKNVWSKAKKFSIKLCKNRKPFPKVNGLLEAYKLSLLFKFKLMRSNLGTDGKNIKSMIDYFKKEHLNLKINLNNPKKNQVAKNLTEQIIKVLISKENIPNSMRCSDYLRHEKVICVKSVTGKTVCNNAILPKLKRLRRIQKYKTHKKNLSILMLAKKIERKYRINNQKKIRICRAEKIN